MQRQNSKGLVTYQFETLPADSVVHAVFSRLGGVSCGPFASLNMGNSVGDDRAAVAENHARVFAHLALRPERIVTCRQIHSNRVAVVTDHDGGQTIPGTDGLVTNVPGLALLLRFADCQPILLYDPVHHALGLVHAGWRGVAQGMARRAVETMQAAFATDPQDLITALGPAIGPCCYTVGHEVASAMGYALPDWSRVMSLEEERWRFDLPEANAQQLAAAGVRRIEQAHLCTACHNDDFFSHRADKGETGRFAVVAYLKTRAVDDQPRGTEQAPKEMEPDNPTEPDSLNPPGFPAFHDLPAGEP